MKKFIVFTGIVVAGALILLIIGGWLYGGDYTNLERNSTTVVLTIESRGGMCLHGNCKTKIDIHSDGSFTYLKTDDSLVAGNISAEEVRELENLIDSADFAAIKSSKFTGECPVNLDGQEQIYTFHSNGEVIAGCTYNIDFNSLLFAHIYRLNSKIFE